MVALTAAKVGSFIKSPDLTVRAILLYGPDIGLIREYAKSLAGKLSKSSQDEGEIIRLDDSDIVQNPERLAVELQTIPMFGGEKVVCLRAGQKANAAVIEPLIKDKLGSFLIVEAGDLKKGVKLRQIFEKDKSAIALPCYGDDSRSLSNLIDEEFKAAKVSLSPQVKDYLQAQLGADRALSRAEIQKLLLYIHGRSEVSIDDIDAVIGDASNLSIEQIIYACANGQRDQALLHFERALAAGFTSATVLILLNKHFMQLHSASSQMDMGETVDMVIRKMRPPIHFKRQAHFKAQCQRWSSKHLLTGLDLIQQTTVRSRSKIASSGEMERVFVERLLMSLAQMVKR